MTIMCSNIGRNTVTADSVPNFDGSVYGCRYLKLIWHKINGLSTRRFHEIFFKNYYAQKNKLNIQKTNTRNLKSLTLSGTGQDIFILLNLLDQIVSADFFFSKFSKHFWR